MRRRLSRLQLAVMQVLWERGRATVADVQEAIRTDQELAYSTLATILRRMERQGVVQHTVEGRTYLYEPLLAPENVGHSLIGDLVERVFAGSPSRLVSHLLESQSVDADELARIRAMIDEHARQPPRKKKKGDSA
ncbi:MAG: BlaI/MecI/CopY family transcriptional regulator [Planctomycetaceae bacterium]